MRLSITVDPKQYAQAVRELSGFRNGAAKALAAALNKTMRGVKTDTVREVRDNYEVKYGTILKALKITRKASKSDLVTIINGRYTPIPLMQFKVSPKRTQGIRPAGGLKITVKKGSSSSAAHAFVAALGGGTNVFTRAGSSRLPIKTRYGPAIVQMLDNPDVDDKIQRQAQERLNKNLAHEIDRISKGFGSGRGKVDRL